MKVVQVPQGRLFSLGFFKASSILSNSDLWSFYVVWYESDNPVETEVFRDLVNYFLKIP